MKAIRRTQAGETLLEIIMTLVIIGLVVSAYFAAFSTQGTATASQRNLVTADGLLRDYAEATKSAVRTDCLSSTTFTTTTTSVPGFSVASSTNQCPQDPSSPQQVDIAVGMQNATPPIVPDCSRQQPNVHCMSIFVRTP